MKVWTLRLDGERRPFLWLTHEGDESQALIDRTVARAKDRGLDVVVGLTRRRRPEPPPPPTSAHCCACGQSFPLDELTAPQAWTTPGVEEALLCRGCRVRR
jgi:hypothetical protein